MIYYRCYIEDYDKDTKELSMIEDGAYGRLLRYYYQSEKPLPLKEESLARITRAITDEERDAVNSVLETFFRRQDDGWHQKRTDHEIKVSQVARDNGSRGGRPVANETDEVTGSETTVATGSRTTPRTRKVTGSGQPISLSSSQPSNLSPLPHSDEAAPRGRKVGETGETWKAYSAAYQQRYGIEPVRNARVNGQLASVVRCVGRDEAPSVAAFYVTHSRGTYVAAKHPTSLLARDAEGLRTEWATNRKVGETEARQADRTQATGTVFNRLLDESDSERSIPQNQAVGS